ncbi:DUF4097 family beta strand repeat protein [bacterium]|nr:DUF4097 family beta strand repeat protein [bacterium]
MKRLMLSILVLSLMSAAVLQASVRERRTYEESCAWKAGETVIVENVNGNISVEAWDKESVEAVADVEFRGRRGRTVDDVIAETSLKVERTPEGIRVRLSRPRATDGASDFWSWIFSGGSRVNVNAQIRVRVPASAGVEAETTNGNCSAAGVRGPLDIGTTNGNADAEDTAGSVNASSTNGDIRVDVRSLPEKARVSCRTTNGNVRLSLPAKINADVDLSTTNGRVKSSYPITMEGGFSGKHVNGRIGEGGASIRCSTTNGNVDLSEGP